MSFCEELLLSQQLGKNDWTSDDSLDLDQEQTQIPVKKQRILELFFLNQNIPKDKKISEPITNLIDGLKMVQKEFNSILAKHGITKIDALNKKFDHNLHQAMLEVETDKEEGIVVQELQSGYTMHDRLLRPSMVGVSKKTQKNQKK